MSAHPALRNAFLLCAFYALGFFGWPGIAQPCARGDEILFNRDIRPILSDKCFFCHGPDSGKRKAGLRLDLPEEAFKDRDGVRAWIPGKPDESEAILRILSDDAAEKMPPSSSNLKLTDAEKATLRDWVQQGATYQPHWAFVPLPDKVVAPPVKNAAWPRSDLDRFVLARLEREGLAPAPEASRERWLRRATYDLTGLPPTQPEIDAFLADSTGDAYERAADRLLKSPRFGERMAVSWLDLARYADSFGYQADVETHAWPYRDWVIRAFNENMPWDQFIIRQLAGDLLPDPTPDQKLATAFNRLHRKTNEGGSVPEEFRQDGVSDRVHTFGTAFLGLTLECARCHDHKYDPVSMRDYYAFSAYFNSIDEYGLLQGSGGGRVLPEPVMELPTKEQAELLASQRATIERQERIVRALPAQREDAFRAWLAAKPQAVYADRVAQLSCDELADGSTPNLVEKTQPGRGGSLRLVPGRAGQAVLLNGDDAMTLPDFGVRHAQDPVTLSFWLKPSENYPRAVVVSNTSGTDNSYCGYELLLENGRLRLSVMREYPGNAISIQSEETIPVGQWTHITASYDGSMRASGLALYLNGKPATALVLRDQLLSDYLIGRGIEFGARMRDNGLRGGAVDDIQVFTRAVTPLEAAQFADGKSLADLLAKPAPSIPEIAQLRAYYFSAVDPVLRENVALLHKAREARQKTMDGVRDVAVMEESAAPRPTFVLRRGAYDAPAERVERSVPAAFPPLPNGAPNNRLGLAQWLTLPNHPLTTRVLMNRLWQDFFGRGLVLTAENFGSQGAQPSHPELLDWLARDFINHGWDFKYACRRIVLSATYRQDSKTSPAQRQRDPDNVLLGRGPARRLSAEMLRDGALALGGLLNPVIGGPPVKPYQPDGSMWKALNNFLPEYQRDRGNALYRRSLYTFWRRTTTPPNMMVFDTPTRDVCTVRRQTTMTPLQPLVLMNDPQFVEAARGLGERMLREGGANLNDRLTWLYREVTGRTPTEAERILLNTLYVNQRTIFLNDASAAKKLLAIGEHPADLRFPAAELAAATAVASAVFNLDASLVLR